MLSLCLTLRLRNAVTGVCENRRRLVRLEQRPAPGKSAVSAVFAQHVVSV